MRLPRLPNIKGELFASTFTYGIGTVVKLGSSLILTRLLDPQAYGIFGIVVSLMAIIEMSFDVGTFAYLVRHPRGHEKLVVHTIWTVRFFRCIAAFLLMFALAPVAAGFYHQPVLTNAYRVLSFCFLISGLESMAYILAPRDQRARLTNYADLLSSIGATVFTISLAQVLKSHMAFIAGLLFQRALLTISSHFFYRDIGVGLAFDRETLRGQFEFSRVVIPSTLLSMVLSQYDKFILLRLFDLRLLGIYGLACNMIGPASGIVLHNARVILYARVADYFRTDRASAVSRYYSENRNLFLIGILLPSLVAGFARPLIEVLYDARYAAVGPTLTVLAVASLFASFQNTSENLVVAAGKTHVVLVANIIRVCTLIPMTLLGYYLFGFMGFVWFVCFATLPPLLYYYYEQHKIGALDLGQELKLYAIAAATLGLCLAAGQLLLMALPPDWLHLSLRKHLANR